jgi:hypothetical protein
VVNIVLILGLLIIAFANISRFSLDTYTIKKALPNLIVGVVLANASFFIIKFLVDINSVAVQFFVDLSTGGSFRNLVAAALSGISLEVVETIGWGSAFLLIIFLLVSLIIILWLALMLYIRLIVIYLLAILSPLAFVAYGIPGVGDKYFKMWWQNFVKWLFMPVIMAAIFWLMLAITNGQSHSITQLIIAYVLFFFALTTPTRVGGSIMNKASSAFMKYTGINAARKSTAEWAGRTGQQLALRAPLYGRIAKSMENAKKAQEQDIKNLWTSAERKAAGGKNYRKYARTLKRNEELSGYLAAQQAESRVAALDNPRANRLDRLQGRGRPLDQRAIEAYYEKGVAEGMEKMDANERKAKFTQDESADVKELMSKFWMVSSRDKALAEAVGKIEQYATGDYTRDRKDVLTKLIAAAKTKGEIDTIEGKSDAERTREEKARLPFLKMEHEENQADLNNLLKNHEDLRNMTAEEAINKFNQDKTFGKLIGFEEKRQNKEYNVAIRGRNEDTVESSSVEEVLNDINSNLNKGFDKLHGDELETAKQAAKRAVLERKTLGVSAKNQDSILLGINALASMARNQQHPMGPGALRALAKMILEDGHQNITVTNKAGQQVVYDNSAAFDAALAKPEKGFNQNDMKRSVLSHKAISGTPGSHLGDTEGIPPTAPTPPGGPSTP